ncbi:hypothetical protein EPN83_01015 [Patescibacteria group bacterium]|nr:MAG: hypothetical protein EPN83_01015 [Patescibacteria group bacterium]
MPQAFIFIGRSGCGKDTQISLLSDFLKQKSDTPILLIEEGESFRKFFAEEGYPNKLSKAIYESGDRQPDFLACFMWTRTILSHYNGREHLIFNGTPRSLPEAKIVETALRFFHFEKPIIVHLDVSRGWSRKHLISRKRYDDLDVSKIEKRLDWFDRDVLPAIDFFKSNPFFSFHEINGEQTIETVQRSIIVSLEPPPSR